MTAILPSAAFAFEGFTLRLDQLLPTRSMEARMKQHAIYRALIASIREVGLVEPLSVFPQKGGKYLIVDGHVRVEALKDLGVEAAPCLLASQDEGYTYNKNVSRVSSIQANRMILKALDAGVPEERIARTLNLSVSTVRSNRWLLQGLCPEAKDLLRNKQVPLKTLSLLKRVKPLRQIEIAEIMIATGTYAVSYAQALVMTTPKDQLVAPEKQEKASSLKPEDLARLEQEARVQERDLRKLDETYNEQVLVLTIARGYLRALLENEEVVRFLAQHYQAYLTELQRIVERGSLEGL